MMRWILPAGGGFWLVVVHLALAAPQVNWNGPACHDGAANFEQCSIDPPTPDDMGACYESHFLDYTPNQIELDMIAVCQAGKSASGSSGDDLANKVQVVVGRVDEFVADINQYPEQASDYADAGKSIGQDMERLGGAVIVYSGDESDDNAQDVQQDLQNLALDSQILGGGH